MIKFNIPTEAHFGHGAVKENAKALVQGRRAFILTGKTSGRRSGALDDVTAILDGAGVAYELFEGIGNNPNVVQCKQLGKAAAQFKADFIIGIGGGSPLDAAKAVAVFALNDISEGEIFKNDFPHGVLPIVAIPTTSGTGSEITPWAIMTWDERKTKLSFGNKQTFPTVALLDPGYTDSLPEGITRNTAMDAFQHCFESFMALKATPVTDALNLYAMGIFKDCMQLLHDGAFEQIREKLMLVSMLGGMTISQTGTTLMHAMGYPLTYFKGIPHGLANCMVLPAYVEELDEYRHDRLQQALAALDMTKAELIAYTKRDYPVNFTPTEEELRLWAQQCEARNPDASTGTPGAAAHIYEAYKRLF